MRTAALLLIVAILGFLGHAAPPSSPRREVAAGGAVQALLAVLEASPEQCSLEQRRTPLTMPAMPVPNGVRLPTQVASSWPCAASDPAPVLRVIDHRQAIRRQRLAAHVPRVPHPIRLG